MDNYNDINNEDNIIEQEQPNGGSLSNGIDPQVVADIAAKVNAARSQNYDHSNENKLNDKQEEKDEQKKDNNLVQGAKKGASEALKDNATKKGVEAAGTKAGMSGAATAAGSAGTAATAGAAGATGTAAATAGTAGASAGGIALLANPVFWIVVGIVVLLLLVILIYIATDMTQQSTVMAQATGVPQEIMDEQCDDDDQDCLDMVNLLTGEYQNLGEEDAYYALYEYCSDKMTFGQKLKEKISNIFNIESDSFEDQCEVTRFIEKTLVKKEEKINKDYSTNIRLSRGLILSTLYHLYDGSTTIPEDGTETNETSSYNYVDGTNSDSIIINVLKNGAITRNDITMLVDNMVFEENYTYYEWKEETNTETEKIPDNKVSELIANGKIGQYTKDKNGDYIWTITTHTYSCEAKPEKRAFFSRGKYFLFLRYGGNYENDTWSQLNIENGKIPSSNLDAVTSYQELTTYNASWQAADPKCSSGEYASPSNDSENPNLGISRKEDTDTEKYIYDNTIETANHAYPYKGMVDTTGYEGNKNIYEDELYTTRKVTGLSGPCVLNNATLNDTTCTLTDSFEIDYRKGFVYIKFQQFKKYIEDSGMNGAELSAEDYDYLSETIENNISLIKNAEDILNEIFGFEKIPDEDLIYTPGLTNGVGSSSLCIYQDKPIRLISSNASKAKSFNGGSTYTNGAYIANETISLKEFIMQVAYAEIGGYLKQEYIEAVKFNLIVIKSVILSDGRYDGGRVEEKNGELYVKIDNFVAYKSISKMSSSQKSVFENAYNAIKDILMYEKGSQNVFHALYGASLQNRTAALVKNGLTYSEILKHSSVQEYFKDETSHYDNAEFKNCSSLLSEDSGGIYNGRIDTTWPFFPEGTNYTVSNYSMFLCRTNDGEPDFHAAVDLPVPGGTGTPITCPIDGIVISSNYYNCGNGIVKVEGTIPGTDEKVTLQFTHMDKDVIKNGSLVKANQTIIGRLASGNNDNCSSGVHLDFKVYNSTTKRYYNPSVFVSGILLNSTNIPQSSFVYGYNNQAGPTGYDKCCAGRSGQLPQC